MGNGATKKPSLPVAAVSETWDYLPTKQNSYITKIILTGDYKSGQSSIIRRYVFGSFLPRQISLFQTAQQQYFNIDFRCIFYINSDNQRDYMGAQVFLIVIHPQGDVLKQMDIGNERVKVLSGRNSIQSGFVISCIDKYPQLNLWPTIKYIIFSRQSGGIWSLVPREILHLICASFGGTQTAVSETTLTQKASSLGVPIYFASAKTGQGINEMFEDIFRRIASAMSDRDKFKNEIN